MKRQDKKKVAVVTGLGVLLWAAVSRAAGRGRVIIGPVTYTDQKVDLGPHEPAIARLTLALTRSRQLMGADPNTVASRQVTGPDLAFVEDTLRLGRELAQATNGLVPYPEAEQKRLALSVTLPGDVLQKANGVFYTLLGIDPNGSNAPTKALSAESEALARQVIAKWRPYSLDAVDTLFALLDEARELGGAA